MHDSVISLLKDKAAPGCALLAAVFEEYGAACFDWEPQVLRLEILSDFGVELTAQQSDKLQAAITIISLDQFEHHWNAFNNSIHALNGEPFEFDELHPLDAEQIAAALPEIAVLRNDFLGEGIEYSDEVNAYVGFIFSDYGLLSAPNIFPTALMPHLDGSFFMDSQADKKDALDQIYAAKKAKLAKYTDCVKHVFNC